MLSASRSKDFSMNKKSQLNHAPHSKLFFAYHRAENWGQIEDQRVRCEALVGKWGGVIADDAADVGPGVFVDMPGYARLYEALERPTVDAFVTDMTAFGPTAILGLYAICAVSGVEMWDLTGGRVTKAQIYGIRDSFLHRLGNNADGARESIQDMLSTPNSLS
jgi:hypothetical protein